MLHEATEQQRHLGDSLQRYLRREHDFARRRRLANEGVGDPELWRGLRELGLPGLLVPEQHGGLQAPLADLLHALQVLGPALVLEPVLGSCLLATDLLASCGGEVAAHWLQRLAQGAIASIAVFEPAAGFAIEQPRCQAHAEAGGWLLDGDKTLLLQPARAEVLLVAARCPDAQLAWFAVPAQAVGVRLRGYALLDGQPAADLQLRQVRLAQPARLPGDALAAARRLRDLWLAGLCAGAVGVLQACLDASVEYLRTRHQFGAPLATQQVLRHRASAMWIEVEQARSLAWLAARRFDTLRPDERAELLAAAKARVGSACRQVGQQSVQLHGGIGLTDELPLSHWFKHLTLVDQWLGHAALQVQRYAELAGEEDLR